MTTTTAITVAQVEQHYSNLTALLVQAAQQTLGLVEFTPFSQRVLDLVEQDSWRQAYNLPLDRETISVVADLYSETFIDPYDLD